MHAKPSLKRLFIITIVTSLVGSALAGITVLLKGSFDDTDGKVLGTTLALGVFSVTALANLRTMESPVEGQRLFSWASIAVSGAAFAFIAYLIWSDSNLFDDNTWKVATVLSVLAVSSAHASLLLPVRSRGGWINLAVTSTLGMIAIVAAMIIYIVIAGDADIADLFYRLLGVFAILDVLGTITTPLLAKFTKRNAGVQ